MLWVNYLLAVTSNRFTSKAMHSPMYQLRSQGPVDEPSENLCRKRKSRKTSSKARKEESETKSSSTSATPSSAAESSETDSSTTLSSSVTKPHKLHRQERSETSISDSSSELSDSESSSTSSETSESSVTVGDYTHLPDSIPTIDQDILQPDYTGVTLNEAIKTDELLIKWLSENGLLGQRMSCATHMCELVIQSVMNKGTQTYVWACPVQPCSIQLPITSGTIFTLFRANPRKVLFVILDWLLGHQRPETLVSTGLTKNTLSRANVILRVCAYLIISRSHLNSIGGPDTVVEVDEAELHRRKAKKGRLKQAGWVVGGVQRGPAGSIKPCFFELVQNRSKDVLLDVIHRHVKPGTTIVTDAWKGYAALDLPGSDYSHAIINHSTRFSDGAGIYTQTIEGIWHHLRRSALPSHGCSIVDIEYFISQHILRKVTGLNLVSTIKLLNTLDFSEVRKHLAQRKKLIRREKKLAHRWKKLQRKKQENHRMKRARGLAQEELNKTLSEDIRKLLAETADVQKKAKTSSAKSTYERLRKVQDGILLIITLLF